MSENRLLAGFGRVDITPPIGMPVAGYFVDRFANGVLDRLEIQALAVSDSEKKAVILSADLLGIKASDLDPIRKNISETLGIPVEAVFIACTHTHTGPVVRTALWVRCPKNGTFTWKLSHQSLPMRLFLR